MPDQEDIEKIVGLVNSNIKIKTLHEMIKEKSQEEFEEEEARAKEFIDKMKMKRAEIDAIKES